MKKIILLVSLLLTTVLLSGVNATPVYYGDTDASYGEGGVPALPTSSGYYIWSNNPERTSWSVRWTGNNNGSAYDWVDWYGSIEIGTGLNMESVTEVMFEDGHSDDTTSFSIPGLGDFITFEGYAGNAWDGFDFTISGDIGNVIGFNLGSTLWSDNDFIASPTPVSGSDIYIGADFNTPDVLVSIDSDGFVYQNFEVPAPVPEPATMILLGTGLLGFAGARRKKKK